MVDPPALRRDTLLTPGIQGRRVAIPREADTRPLGTPLRGTEGIGGTPLPGDTTGGQLRQDQEGPTRGMIREGMDPLEEDHLGDQGRRPPVDPLQGHQLDPRHRSKLS